MLGDAIDSVYSLVEYSRDDTVADTDTFQDAKASVNFEKLSDWETPTG